MPNCRLRIKKALRKLPVFSAVLFLLFTASGSERVIYSNSGGRIRTFDPIYADDLASRDIAGAVFDTLVEYDYTMRPYRLKPSMLKKMPTANADFTRYDFELRDDLFFQEVNALAGVSKSERKITSADVRYSILRLADSRLHSPLYWLVRGRIAGINDFHARSASARDNKIYDTGISGFVIKSDTRFSIILTAPDPRFLYRLALPNMGIVPRRAAESGGRHFGRRPAGSGAFMLNSWINDYKIVLKRNPEYRQEFFAGAESAQDRTRQLPLADRIEIFLIRQPMTGYLMFLRGDLDYHALDKDKADAAAPGGKLVPALAKRDVRLVSFPEFEVRYVGFNFRDEKLKNNLKLRAALTAAYDVQRRVEFTNNQLIPVTSPVPPDVSGACREIVHPYAGAGIKKAAKLLAEAGYPDGKDPATGKALELTFDQSGSSTLHRQYGELAAADFAKLGINVKSVLNNNPRFYEKLRQGNIQLFRLSWIGDYPDAENFLQLFYSGNAGGCNRCNYSNPEFDRMYEAASKLPDSPRREELYRKMAELVNRDCVWILEGIPLSWQLRHGWLQNFRHHDFGFVRWKYMSVSPEKRAKMKKTFTPLSFKELNFK